MSHRTDTSLFINSDRVSLDASSPFNMELEYMNVANSTSNIDRSILFTHASSFNSVFAISMLVSIKRQQ